MNGDGEDSERRYDSDEWERRWTQETKESETDLSPYFREIVTVLFTVVVAFSIQEYNSTLFNNQSAPVDLEFVALLGAYLVIVLSWIGYHYLVSKYPYKAATSFAQFRLISDLSIVFVYAYLLYAVRWIDQPPTSAPEFFGLPVSGEFWYAYILLLAFILYLLNDFLTRAEYPGSNAGHVGKSLIAAFGYVLLMIAHLIPLAFDRPALPYVEPLSLGWATVSLAIGIMVGWRYWIGIGKDR